VIIITDNVMKEFPLITNTMKDLENQGLKVSLFGEIGPNPTEEMVHNAVAVMNQEKPEVIVCIGGGSPIDTGKAANVVYTHGGIVNDYDIAIGGIMKIMPKLLPLIAVATTAGTGTEVTYVGVITDTRNQTKFGVLSPLVIPDVAIIDPELTVSMPAKLTAFTGIDALTHCIEAYTSVVGYPPADALALHGIKMIYRSLKNAVNEPDNLKAREEMLVASMMAGTAFSLNGLGACHAMAHQLSAFFDVPHGLANAVLLPKIIKFNIPVQTGKFADIAQAMGVDINSMSVEAAAQKALELVEQLSDELGVPKYLDEVGASKDKIPELVERAMRDNPITTNPRPATREDVEKLFLESFR
ncbi:MAG: iron-containing alcohol dehydrogenase, partial [Bacillota bacterium]